MCLNCDLNHDLDCDLNQITQTNLFDLNNKFILNRKSPLIKITKHVWMIRLQ